MVWLTTSKLRAVISPFTRILPVRISSEDAVRYKRFADPLIPLPPGAEDPEWNCKDPVGPWALAVPGWAWPPPEEQLT